MSTTTRSLGVPRSATLALPMVRNRSRVLAGAGVIALCALVSVTVFTSTDHRTAVYALAHDVEAGHVIQQSDLRVAKIASDGNVATIAINGPARVVGKVATTRLVTGGLVSPAQIAASAQLPSGVAVVGALLKPGQYPATLHSGEPVMIVTAPAQPGTPASTPINGTVSDISPTQDSSGSVTVSLNVGQADAPTVSAAGGSRALTLAELPQ